MLGRIVLVAVANRRARGLTEKPCGERHRMLLIETVGRRV